MNSVMQCPVVPALAITATLLAACGGVEPPSDEAFAAREYGPLEAQPCAHSVPTRQALFGDLHVHTALSSDAWNFGVRAGPQDAYRYAFGETLSLPAAQAGSFREVRIDRPLDFAAVTDHAEFLGEQSACHDPGSAAYSASFCEVMRSGEGRAPQLLAKIMLPFSSRDSEVCGADGVRCAERAEDVWGDIIAAAQQWQDTSSNCERTTFIAYEYSSFRMGSNLHRNVIFRNSAVLARPVSYIDRQREWELWQILRDQCWNSSTGCDALAIPHNSNISNGRMFAVDYPGAYGVDEQAARARLRQQMEPLVEIMQHKGDSECRNGLPGVLGSVDELCNFEKFENQVFRNASGLYEEPGECYGGPLADWVPHLGPNCLEPRSYVRYALIEGLREERRIGVNPFKMGLMASTDTHNALAGGVAESGFPGHLGVGDATVVQRVQFKSDIPGNASNNPGGLIGVWAEENSRDAIFNAMRRREVFGTSGPRISPRLFAGWNLASDLCERPDMLELAYAEGVPMGSDLPPAPSAAAPRFLVLAAADPRTPALPGVGLQRLQMIKGWSGDDGKYHQAVFDVAGSADNGATVDPLSCEPRGEGAAQLCSVWQDPDFDPSVGAVYYLRAVENPTCRYSARQCLTLPAEERPADCDAPFFEPLIQERAWTSPVWYTPPG
tara:strand:- start:12629 stop:14629 length:2001 start_codon:yes stop_codon:yes gene_type:complete